MHTMTTPHSCPQSQYLQPALAHRRKPDSTQQGGGGRPPGGSPRPPDTAKRTSPQPLPMTATLLFVVPARSGGRALTGPDLSARYQQTGENQYLISPTARGDKHLQGRWTDGEELVVDEVSSVRAQGAGRPRERGEKSVHTIGRNRTTTIIGTACGRIK